MSWFETILKRDIPFAMTGMKYNPLFLFVLGNRKQMENYLQKARESNTDLATLNGWFSNNSDFDFYWNQVEQMRENATFPKDLPKEEAKKMFEELVKVAKEKQENYASADKVGITPLLDAAIKLRRESLTLTDAEDLDKKKEIVDKIQQTYKKILSMKPKTSGWWAKNRPLLDKLNEIEKTTLDVPKKNYLSFESEDLDEGILKQFAEMIGGEYKDRIILVDFKHYTKPSKYNNPKEEQQEVFVAKLHEIDENGKKPILEFFREKIRPLGVKFNEGKNTSNVSVKEIEAYNLNIKGVKLQAVDKSFDYSLVEKYLNAVNSLPAGSKQAFAPDAGQRVSRRLYEVILLERLSKSTKQLTLNPYADIIMANTFDDNWYTDFFRQIKNTQIVGKEAVRRMIKEDIARSLFARRDTSVKFGIGLTPFLTTPIEKLVDKGENKQTFKKLKEEITKILDSSSEQGGIGDRVATKGNEYRKQQLDFLERYFLFKEGLAIGRELEDLGSEVTAEYFTESGELIDVGSDALIDASREDDLTEFPQEPVYIKLTVDFEFDTPQEIQEYAEEMGSDPEDLKDLEDSLKGMTEKLKKLTSTRARSKVTAEGIKESKVSEEYAREVKDIGLKIKDLQERIKVGKSKTLREGLFQTNSFENYIMNLIQQDKLESLVNSSASDLTFASSESIKPETSIIFFSLLDPRLPNAPPLPSNAKSTVGDTLLNINELVKKEEGEKAREVLSSLNDYMPTFLNYVKKAFLESFKRQVEFFAKNFGTTKFNKEQVSAAVKKFKELGLIEEV